MQVGEERGCAEAWQRLRPEIEQSARVRGLNYAVLAKAHARGALDRRPPMVHLGF